MMMILFDIFSSISDILGNPALIVDYLKFDPKYPLLFNSGFFLAFFFLFYGGYYLLRNQQHDLYRKIYLIVFSVYFYYKAGGFILSFYVFGLAIHINYFLILVFCAIATDYLARKMYAATETNSRKLWLTLIIVGNLVMLAYFKYTGFIFENLNALFSSDFSISKIILPIGISFFVFEAISYAIDLYRKEMVPAKSTLDFCFYIAFFPKLVAGPIIRAKDFLPQMNQKLQLTKEVANKALFLILIGLIKKAIISDYISTNFVDRVFDSPLSYTSFENLLAVYGYTLQIYCDFSGYSDIAIGLSLLMGFVIPPNFRTPYKSQSITEFWRRWHISLSSWLRDYLYISLGGNRRGKIRTYVNLFLTMLIGGLWHGASWKFVVWGALHGLLLGIERYTRQFIPLSGNSRWGRSWRILLTFHLIAFCWIFFRADSFSVANSIISHIGNLAFAPSQWLTIIGGYQNVLILVAIGYTLHFLPEDIVDRTKRLINNFSDYVVGKWYWLDNVTIKTELLPVVVKGVVLGFVMWLIYATMSSGPQPFIYFQF